MITLKNLTVCYYHVIPAFQSESTLCSYLNVKELLAISEVAKELLATSEVYMTTTGFKLTTQLNNLVSLAEWFSNRLRTKNLWVPISLLSFKLEKVSPIKYQPSPVQ